MKTTQYIFALFLSVSSCMAYAQDEPDNIVETFFKKFKENPDAAFDYLYSNNEWMQRSRDEIENLKLQVRQTTSMIGKYTGYELMDRRTMGKSFILYSYMVKYERQPLRFVFEFYKPEDDWKTYGFSFDKNPDIDIENASRNAVGK